MINYSSERRSMYVHKALAVRSFVECINYNMRGRLENESLY